MTTTSAFHGRVAVLQRVLPDYRIPFFDPLAAACAGSLSVYAGNPHPDESIPTGGSPGLAEHYPGRNLHFRRPSSPYFFCWQRGLTRWLSATQPQALIVEANPRYWSTWLVVRWMHARRLPVIGWGLGVGGGGGGLRLAGWRRFLSQFDGMIAYSQRGAEQYRSMGLPAQRVYVALNAASPRPDGPPPQRPLEFAGRPVALFVGRLQNRKRIDLLLASCAALPPAVQPRLLVVGDGPARGELQALAERVYPLAEFTGPRFGTDLLPYFSQADLFVLPGTGGLAVQQAMAHGLPVIAAEGDGTQEDLVRPANGWRVPPGDGGALQAALQTALSDVSRLRRMGAESYRIVNEEANLEAMVGVFVRALNEVKAGSSPA